eukprot:Awhi_evm1s13197
MSTSENAAAMESGITKKGDFDINESSLNAINLNSDSFDAIAAEEIVTTTRDSFTELEVEDDPYEVKFVVEKTRIPPFALMNWKQKTFKICSDIFKVIILIACLFCFIIALSLLGSAFQIISGTTVGKTFRNSDIFDNPIAGLVIGILATVLVQSSSTSTSIIVSMVASRLLTIDQAVYMIMGANIGTSVTNTIVSMTQISNTNIFRRAFAGACVHDMFNFLSVLVLLPLQAATKCITKVSEACVESMNLEADVVDADFLKKLTKPVTSRIISVDKKLITRIGIETNETTLNDLYKLSMVKWSKCDDDSTWFVYCPNESWSDTVVGLTLLLWSLVMLVICLLVMVKILQCLLSGNIAVVLHKAINTEFRFPFGYLRGYLLIAVGIGITILVQSSSVTTSSLVPLVGIGVLNLKTLYPITLGANIGTTVTSILASFSQSEVGLALTVAFCHLFFNVFGIVIWFVVPITRRVPIGASKKLGNITAKHRWFAAFYILTVFVVIPLLLFGLSLAGWVVMFLVLLPFALLGLFVGVVFLFRRYKPSVLPPYLMKFYWLPKWIRHEPAWLKAIHNGMAKKAAKKEEKAAAKKALGLPTTMEKIYGRLGPLVELQSEDSKKSEDETTSKKHMQLSHELEVTTEV